MKRSSLALAAVAIGLMAAGAARAEGSTDLAGQEVPVSQAQRTVVVTPSTRRESCFATVAWDFIF